MFERHFLFFPVMDIDLVSMQLTLINYLYSSSRFHFCTKNVIKNLTYIKCKSCKAYHLKLLTRQHMYSEQTKVLHPASSADGAMFCPRKEGFIYILLAICNFCVLNWLYFCITSSKLLYSKYVTFLKYNLCRFELSQWNTPMVKCNILFYVF